MEVIQKSFFLIKFVRTLGSLYVMILLIRYC